MTPHPSRTAPPAPPPGVEPAVVLLVSGRPELVEEVGRLAAAAVVPVRAVRSLEEAAGDFARAPLVLLGDDAADVGAPWRRSGVVVLRTAATGERVWRRAVEVGAEAVLELPLQAGELLARLGAAAEPVGRAGRAGRVVGVVGGSGGAGASVLAAAVATVAASDRGERPRRRGAGRSVVLVDADPTSAGADVLLGVEDDPGLRWPDLIEARGAVRAAVLRDGVPVAASGARVLSWGAGRPDALDLLQAPPAARGLAAAASWPAAPAPAAAVEAVLDAACRAHDLVVVDLPRRDDPATLAVLWRTDLLVVLARTELRAVLAAAVVRDLAVRHAGDVRLALAPAAGSGLAAADAADVLGLPVVARVPRAPGLDADVARRLPPGSRRGSGLARAAARVVAAVEQLDDPLPDPDADQDAGRRAGRRAAPLAGRGSVA